MNSKSTVTEKELPIEETINSLSEFTNFLLQKGKDCSQEFVYRGEENYPGNIGKLTPYIFREDKKRIIEKNLINTVINERPNDFENSSSTLDILIKMQHYGIPTRLLDISYNPYKALYFALENPFDRNKKEDGFFYMIDKKCFKEKPINSDAVSIVSSISRLSNEDKRELSETYKFYLLSKTLVYKILVKNIHEQINSSADGVRCSLIIKKLESFLGKLNLDDELPKIEKSVKSDMDSITNHEKLSTCYQHDASIKTYGIPYCRHTEIQEGLNYIVAEYKNIMSFLENQLSSEKLDKLEGIESEYLLNLKKSFNEFLIIQKLLHEVRNFNPGFKDVLVMDDLVKSYLILPRNTNQRIINQEGGFILSGLQLSSNNIVIDKNKVTRIKIPQKSKKGILEDLGKLHSISESYIYPELDHYNFRKFEQNEYVIDNHRIKIDGSKVTVFSLKDEKSLKNKQNFLLNTLKKKTKGQPELLTGNNNSEIAKKLFNILYDENEKIK